MSESKNAFTLIEMLVVIFIITVILMITMNFSGDRIQLLNNKNTQEEFITAFNEQYLISSNSNYIDGKLYDELEISFEKDKNSFSYGYKLKDNVHTSGTNNVLDKIKIKEICISNQSKQNLNIQYTPYELGCKLNGNAGGNAIIKIGVNNDREEYCFKISSQLGRLITMKKCPASCNNLTVTTDDMSSTDYIHPNDDK